MEHTVIFTESYTENFRRYEHLFDEQLSDQYSRLIRYLKHREKRLRNIVKSLYPIYEKEYEISDTWASMRIWLEADNTKVGVIAKFEYDSVNNIVQVIPIVLELADWRKSK